MSAIETARALCANSEVNLVTYACLVASLDSVVVLVVARHGFDADQLPSRLLRSPFPRLFETKSRSKNEVWEKLIGANILETNQNVPLLALTVYE